MKDNGGNMDLSNENMIHVKKDGIEYFSTCVHIECR